MKYELWVSEVLMGWNEEGCEYGWISAKWVWKWLAEVEGEKLRFFRAKKKHRSNGGQWGTKKNGEKKRRALKGYYLELLETQL